MYLLSYNPKTRTPWNKGKIIGQKAPFKLRDIWAIRIRLQMNNRLRDLALFNLAIDSKLRGCDLVKLRLSDISHGDQIARRAIILQQMSQRPAQFELTDQTRESVSRWVEYAGLDTGDHLSRAESGVLTTSRPGSMPESLIHGFLILESTPAAYVTHSLRRTKASMIYRRTGNLRAVQILLGHTKIGKHGSIPWDKCGRCLGVGRTDRNLGLFGGWLA